MTIVEFLLARIAEDEAGAAEMEANRRRMSACGESHNVEIRREPFGTVRWLDSGRVLVECQAKRAIIELAEDATGLDVSVDNEFRSGPRDETAEPYVGDRILYQLATVYADHPEYREEWRA